MSTTYLFGSNSILAKIDNFTSLGMDTKLDKLLGFTRPEIEGPRLSDLSVQTSTYGADIPRLYGTISVMGNVIQLENNKLKETVRKKKSGGKGGGGASEPTKTYSYSATFQLALCEGPIAGIRRMWCGDKLIYNAGSDDLETIIASNQAAKGWKLYLGTDDQMPDPRYEAEYGVGNVSAHRGLAYIAFYDFKLADYSNTLQAAQFKVEVVRPSAGLYTNSHIYIAMDLSGSMSAITENGQTRLQNAQTSINSTLDFIRDEIIAAGYGVNIFIVGWGGRGDPEFSPIARESIQRLSVGPDEIEELKSWVEDRGSSYYGTDFRAAAEDAPTYFSLAPDGYRKISLFITDGSPTDPAGTGDTQQQIAEAAGDTLLSVPDLLAFGFNIDLSNTDFTEYMDNTSWDGVPVVDGGDPEQLKDALTAALQKVSAQSDLVSYVLESEVGLSGLISNADINTSGILSSLRGYRVSGGSVRSALEPLRAAFPFDVRPSGYQIEFLPRGQASVATIPWEDLGATSGDTPDDIFQQSREMDTQLPAKTVVKYLDAAREYAINEQFSERLNTEAINKVERDLAIVLTADEAAGIAEMLNFLPWLERTPASFTLPPPYRYLQAADVVTVVSATATYEIRLTEANETQDGRLECQAVPNRAALYTPAAVGSEGVPPTGTVPLAGESLFVPLDIPVIDETLQDAPGFVGVMTGYTGGWPGAIAVRSIDGGQTWADLQAYNGKATIGTTDDILPASDCTLIDQRSLTVDLISGELDSVTRDQMLAGINYAAYGVDGRWEIVRFQNAVLQAGGEYLISSFVRGEKGTEWATGLHETGDYFILLDDPDNAFIGTAIGSIAAPATYRGVTSGASVDDSTDVLFTYQGVNLECLSPVYASGARDGSDNFTGTFTRRSRLSSSWWATGVAAPVGEASEAYEIDVMDGSDVARTISVSAPIFAYSATDQATDFGSAQASITFRIYQLSATVGRGYPLEVTL